MTSRIAIAAKFNNRAVSLLDTGDVSAAIVQFSAALKVVQKFNIEHRDEVESESFDHGNMSNITLDECMIHSQDLYNNVDTESDEEDHQTSFVHRQAIVILPNRNNYSASVTTSVAILFNLALAHQVLADEEIGTAQSKTLIKATKLYQLALSCCEDLDTTSSWDGFLLFAMTATNNMAMAYQSLQHNEASGECLQDLLSMVVLLVDLDSGNRKALSFCNRFLRNTSHLVAPQITAAAA